MLARMDLKTNLFYTLNFNKPIYIDFLINYACAKNKSFQFNHQYN